MDFQYGKPLWVVSCFLFTIISQATPQDLVSSKAMIVRVLRNYGYSVLATSIELTNLELISLANQDQGLTLFAPTDVALASVDLSTPLFLPILQYHLCPGHFLYNNLLSIPSGTRVNTLLLGYSLFITSANDSSHHLTIDNVPIGRPNVFVDDFIVIHGINHIFDPRAFGIGMGPTFPFSPLIPQSKPYTPPMSPSIPLH